MGGVNATLFLLGLGGFLSCLRLAASASDFVLLPPVVCACDGILALLLPELWCDPPELEQYIRILSTFRRSGAVDRKSSIYR